MTTKPDDRWIVIPRWDDFQHRDAVRTGRMPWIKAYTQLVDDDDWLALTAAQRGILLGLWLLYANQRGVLSETGARQELRLQAADARRLTGHLEALNDAGFIAFSASKPARIPRTSAGTEEEKNLSSSRSLGTNASGGDAPPAAKAAAPRRKPSADDGDPYHCPICSEGFRRLEMSTDGSWDDKFTLEAHLIETHELEGDAIDQALARGTA